MGRRVVNFVIAFALAMSMVMAFAPPVVDAAATSSSTSGQAPTMAYAHYQIGHAPTVSEVPLSATPSSKKVTVLAKNQNDPQPMTVAGGYVYWYVGSGQLNRVPETGGKVQTLQVLGGVYEEGVAVKGSYVFWSISNSSSNWFYIARTDVSTGTTLEIYATMSPGITGPFAVNGNHVYFIANSNIYRINSDGSGLVVLATDPSPCPYEDAFSAGVVYWYDICTGQAGSVPASGGTAKLLSPVLSHDGGGGWIGVTQLDVVGSRIYWTFYGGNSSSVDTVNTSGKGFKALYSVTGDQVMFGGVTYSNGNVVFADTYTGAIYSVPQDGGQLHTVVDYPAFNVDAVSGMIFLVSPPDSTVGKTPA